MVIDFEFFENGKEKLMSRRLLGELAILAIHKNRKLIKEVQAEKVVMPILETIIFSLYKGHCEHRGIHFSFFLQLRIKIEINKYRIITTGILTKAVQNESIFKILFKAAQQ